MTEETKQSLVAKDVDESKSQEKRLVEQKSLKEPPEHFQNVSLEPQAVNNLAKFAEKDRDGTQQREAVIRPQQAGKIDFKSLQNHSFSTNRTWPSNKDNPQSPSGKNRNKDKTRKSGRGERGSPQQLYRLSITNARSNPTIGIAYPQQKVSPPKKLECSRGPVSSSYRFHVPRNPEREVDLQQEDFHFRCFQEGSSNINYTSQAVSATPGGPTHHNIAPTPQQQKTSSTEGNTQTVNETLFPDFHLNNTDTWQSPDRTFRNSSFGLSSQKPNNLVDLTKTNGAFIPTQFQFGYPLLEESVSESFPCDPNTQSQDYEISLAPTQGPQNSLSFPSLEANQNTGQFGNDQVEERHSFQLHPKPPQYMPTPHVSSTPPSNDENSASSTYQSAQRNTVPDKSDSFSPVDSRNAGFVGAGKRVGHLKNDTTGQRVAIQGSVHQIRNITQGSTSQLNHHISPEPLEKGVSKHNVRVSNLWDGQNKGFPNPLIDQTTTPYNFQYQPTSEQRQNSGSNGRMPWQQICFTAAMPSQHRIDLSRQTSNQELTYLVGQSDWQDGSKPHNNIEQKDTTNILNKKANEGLSNQRQESSKGSYKTVPVSRFTNNLDMNQSQVGDSKKSIYFGVNHSVPVTSSRNCNYPPLHAGVLGLKMVPPYDSPSNSPSQNTASSSTCSSLSPASTNSVNSNIADDSQVPKGMSPQFYKQQDKANHHHYQSEVLRGLHYNQERAKEVTSSFMSHSRNSKSNMDSAKHCLDTYRTETNPPPPYSAHQLATSLVSANLDQLDVLLRCKQCDQNFNNLVSFLDHKQYCGQHAFSQNELKDVQKVEDLRKFQMDHSKTMPSGSSFGILRSSSDLHLSLLGLNKNGEIVPDTETKGDVKDDPIKLLLPSAPLPDLEVEDPKLDSLITEALNGLGYQSDNTEIDSSFIDAFVDDELTPTRKALNLKESEPRTNNETSVKSQGRCKYPFDSDIDNLKSDKQTEYPVKKSQHELVKNRSLKAETSSSQIQESNCTQIDWEARKSDQTEQENDYSSKFLLSSKFSTRCGLQSVQSSTSLFKATCSRASSASRSPTPQKPRTSEAKRKKTGGGSWSKELIHKIVQQKNKLHKLHVKGTKNLQFSLVMERVTPAAQNPTFKEYDYVTDSDDDCEPVKIASQGRLSQSIRCKYTYTKECKGRIRADKSRESSWKQNQIECFDPKKDLDPSLSMMKGNPEHQRLRRRNSRSSTSSELSTSISMSSDGISSPKSIDHTDSDSEKIIEVQRKDQESLQHNVYEESPARIRKESSTSLALTFTKNTKRYSTDKILLTEHKDHFTTSKCSSIICKTEEAASEHTLTSTVSLGRFKTTRVEIEGKGDHYGFETGIPEESFEADFQNITSPRKSGVALHQRETSNNRDSCHPLKPKKDPAAMKGKSQNKRTNSSEYSVPFFDKANGDVSSEEANRSSNDFFPEPPPLCSSLLNKVCSSPSKAHDDSTQKDRQCLTPYPADHEQSLSFDSMFGDLSVGGFENNLYPEIQLTKESFSPLETTTDKKEIFEPSFSPFLEQRDWNLMDVNPVLPDEISQYKDDSDSTENNSFNNIPFALPEKIMDYTPNLNSSMAVDELEIKRIVTELENQLETAKLNSPTPLNSELPKQLTMSKFSPLRLDPESKDEDSGLEINCSSDNLEIARPADSHLTLFSEPDLPWSSPLTFGVMCGQQGLHTPTHSSTISMTSDSENDQMDMKKHTSLNSEITLHMENKSDSDCLYKSEEMLEHELYTENLMKSLEVISDSLSSGFTSPQTSPNQECMVSEEHEHLDNDPSESNIEEAMNSASEPKVSLDTNSNPDKQDDVAIEQENAATKDIYHEVDLLANEKLDERSIESPESTASLQSDSKELLTSDFERNCASSFCQTTNVDYETRFEVKDTDGESASTSHGHPADKSNESDIHAAVPNIKSPLHQDHSPNYSQEQLASPDHLQKEDFADKHDLDLISGTENKENQQKNIDQSPPRVTFTQAPQISPNSIQSPCEPRDNGPLPETVAFAVNENIQAQENKKPDHIHTGRSADAFESATMEDHYSSIPHLDNKKISESNISTTGTMLSVQSFSKQHLTETSECPESKEGSRVTSDLRDAHQVNYSESSISDATIPSKYLDKGKDLSLILDSTDNSGIVRACASTPEVPLMSILQLNTNEQNTNDQSHQTGYNLPKNSTNVTQNNTFCRDYVDATVDSEVSKQSRNYIDFTHLPDETINNDNEMITGQFHNKPPIPFLEEGSVVPGCTFVKNEDQSIRSSGTNTSQKRCSSQLDVNFQCEMCAMFFRTQPGLKRHKAKKHLVKSEGSPSMESNNENSHIFRSVYDASHPTEKLCKGLMGRAFASYPIHRKASDGQLPQTVTPLLNECTATNSITTEILDGTDQRTRDDAKFNGCPTTIELSCETLATMQDNFADEILKTNMLQAVSPDFPSEIQETSFKSSEKQVSFTSEVNHEFNVNEGLKCNEETSFVDHRWQRRENPYDIDRIVSDCDMNSKCTQETNIPNSLTNIEYESTCSPTKESVGLNGTEPDLKTFFDDESPFSQLFPRNDDRKRKKCARVYGKSNKKQKQLPCLGNCPSGACTGEHGELKENKMFTEDTNDPCGTTTINPMDLLIVTPKGSVEQMCGEIDDTGMTETPKHQGEPQDGTESQNTVLTFPQEDCKLEDSDTASLLQPSDQENVASSPKTELAELSGKSLALFEPDGENPWVTIIPATEVITNDPRKRPVEQKSRRRSEPGLKPKDKQYKCKVCFTWFLTLGELDFHKLSHNPSPPPTCYMCVQRKFSSREQLRDHLREKHGKNKSGVWTCGMCLKEISDVWMYNEHLREHATQFARRGQSQSSLLDMPGCFMQEHAVKNFLSSIMQHRSSRLSKGDSNKTLPKEDRRASFDVTSQEANITKDHDSTKSSFGGENKHCALASLEVLPKAETVKNVQMHPNCKDPSRDCHHCGKQFPKPFKLQRHLVVHNLQKIFLCHKCPVSYQEAKDLKEHLHNEHEETDEQDTKHTTLYTCELCADVMHVIKKSFICSTCNYTFSKKEQFDRHMEKHLVGGNMIFKFRGVVRPSKPFNEIEVETDMPPSKKKKTLESNGEIPESPIQEIPPLLSLIDNNVLKYTKVLSNETNNASVKIEEVADDFSEEAQSVVESTAQTDSPEPCLPLTELKQENEGSSQSRAIQDIECREDNVAEKTTPAENCDVKIEDDFSTIPTVLDNANETDTVERNASDSLEHVEIRDLSLQTLQGDGSLEKEGMEGTPGLISCNYSECVKQDQTIESLFPIKRTEGKDVYSHHRENPTSDLMKQCLKQTLENNPKYLSSASAHNTSSSEDKDSKQQKKRKEPKPPHGFTTARENLHIDPRVKKKFRPSKCENIDGQRKNEGNYTDYPVLTSVKEDTVINKIISKHKVGSLQVKKASMDTFPVKKVEIARHFNGDYKGKKAIPKRPNHSPSSRISTLNSPFIKPRSKPGLRSMETHAYRTAESQNNLLSQLFGQRLTSFKIPLRKDNSESIN